MFERAITIELLLLAQSHVDCKLELRDVHWSRRPLTLWVVVVFAAWRGLYSVLHGTAISAVSCASPTRSALSPSRRSVAYSTATRSVRSIESNEMSRAARSLHCTVIRLRAMNAVEGTSGTTLKDQNFGIFNRQKL